MSNLQSDESNEKACSAPTQESTVIRESNPRSIDVALLSDRNGWKRGYFEYFPILKWRAHLRRNGIRVRFVNSHLDERIKRFDCILVDIRYYRKLIGYQADASKDFMIEFFEHCRKRGQQVVLHDTSDSSSSREFDLIAHVDKFVKKQALKDKSHYVNMPYGDKGYMPWLPDAGDASFRFPACPADQVHKISVGWNIGLCDYRWFPFSEYYPVGTSRLFSQFNVPVKTTNVDTDRRYLTVFRGGIGQHEAYGYQRKIVLRELERMDKHDEIIVGGRVSRRNYFQELVNSRISLSPFGWGEVCYRDFESVLQGTALLKPSMAHLDTYPNLFVENETYVPLEWDLSDMASTLVELDKDHDRRITIAAKAQRTLITAMNDPETFVSCFRTMLA